MQRRHEDKDSLDDFPTPPWATRALMKYGNDYLDFWPLYTCREPAANRGYMARTLKEYFSVVEASDIHDYGAGYPIKDFLHDDFDNVDWTITNPPFVLAKDFIDRALDTSDVGVAVILRIAFLEGKKRYLELFKDRPPSHVFQFVERVPMVKGKYDPDASSATAYAWFVWRKDYKLLEDTKLVWIPPCRDGLINKEKDFV